MFVVAAAEDVDMTESVFEWVTEVECELVLLLLLLLLFVEAVVLLLLE
mgnify:CR=1 FL=1